MRFEIKNKKAKIIDRQNFHAMLAAQTEAEKQAAYENYILTKEINK